ncbi:class I SAM-dependent methyltransferase [Streptomyces sp. NPDC012888]|uniref:class I SAM-dependent methyltransferase n=1 Tax=Streptomyces sp. NPDC012888 TaxID=3364855 RepID=UPI0036CE20A5
MTADSSAERYGDVLFSSGRQGERKRLDGLASALDPVSREVLRSLGVTDRPGLRCLELGAGTGTVGEWLARTAGAHVTAVDRDPVFLTARPGEFDVVRADLAAPGFRPGRFDLVHARLVVMHVREREELLPRLADWLRPGGLLVLSDATAVPEDELLHPGYRQVVLATNRMMEEVVGSDLGIADRYERIFADLGLTGIGTRLDHPLVGADPGYTVFARETVRQAGEHLAGRGITPETLAEVLDHMARPGTRERFFGVRTTWGRKP